MKLYSNRYAPSPRRVRMFAAEKGLSLDIVEVDIRANETQGHDFLAVNPRGEVPVLELDDGSLLTESLAICRHLECLYPEPNLWGITQLEQAEINSMVDRLMFRLYIPVAQAFRHGHSFWAGRVEQVPAYAQVATQSAIKELHSLDSMLDGRPYLCAERFTAADIVGFTTTDFAKVIGLRPEPHQVNLRRWLDIISARPSATD